MTLLLPGLNKGAEPLLRVWQRRRASIAPIGRIFPKAPDIPEEPDECLNLTAVGLSEKSSLYVQLPVLDSDLRDLPEGRKGGRAVEYAQDFCTTPILPGLPGLQGDRRHCNIRSSIREPPDFIIKGLAQQAPGVPGLQIENTPGGSTLKNICSHLEPWLDTLYAEDLANTKVEEGLRRVLFIKKMRIYIEIRKKDCIVHCVPIFHCPWCLEQWAIMGVAPEHCTNKMQPTRGPEILVEGAKARYISMNPRGRSQAARGRLSGVQGEEEMFSGFHQQNKEQDMTLSPYTNSPRDRNDVMELADTPSGYVALNLPSGESVRIDKEILANLDLENLTDEQAIQVLLQSGAIKIDGIESLQEKRKIALNLVEEFAVNEELYDEYARVTEQQSRREVEKDIHFHSQELEEENTGEIFRHVHDVNALMFGNSSPSPEMGETGKLQRYQNGPSYNRSRISGSSEYIRNGNETFTEERGLNIGTGENIRVEVRFNQKQSREEIADENADRIPDICVQDIPQSIKERLFKLLRAQRERKMAVTRLKAGGGRSRDRRQSELVTSEADSAGHVMPKGSRRGSKRVSKNGVSYGLQAAQQRRGVTEGGGATGKHGTSTGGGLLPGRSKISNKGRKKKTPGPIKAWDDPSHISPDLPYDDNLSDADEWKSAQPTPEHFSDAAEMLEYKEVQRQRQASKKNRGVWNKKGQPDTPHQRLGVPYFGVPDNKSTTDTGWGFDQENISTHARRNSSLLGWTDDERDYGASSHIMSSMRGSYINDYESRDGSRRERRGNRKINKKERKDFAKRVTRVHHSKEITAEPLEHFEDTTMAEKHSVMPQGFVSESKRQISITDASHWLNEGAELNRYLLDSEHEAENVLAPLEKNITRTRDAMKAGYELEEHAFDVRASKAYSARPGSYNDEFHPAIGDIRDEVEVVEFNVFSPSPGFDIDEEEDGVEDDDFFEMESASAKSFLRIADLKEVHRLPVTSAYTFSFYELPRQHKDFNDKIKRAACRIGKKHRYKAETKNRKVRRSVV